MIAVIGVAIGVVIACAFWFRSCCEITRLDVKFVIAFGILAGRFGSEFLLLSETK